MSKIMELLDRADRQVRLGRPEQAIETLEQIRGQIGSLAYPTGASCGTCGFRYWEHHGHIIPCPVCELNA